MKIYAPKWLDFYERGQLARLGGVALGMPHFGVSIHAVYKGVDAGL